LCSISSRMSSKIARTSASLVGKRRYSVPLPTPARRAISSTPTSSPASAKAVRAASRTRARLRAASARSGRTLASIASILYPVRRPCEVFTRQRRSRPTRSVACCGRMAVLAETDDRPWLDELNDEQRAAATHSGGPLLILAGAGTGKTTTLCARVAWLVASGVPSERVLLLTFTRRAAREMLQRARGLVPASSRVLGGTFHSVAHRLVRRHAAALGLPGGFGVLDAGDGADLLDLLREEHGHARSKTRFPKKGTLLDIYSRTVNAQQPLSGVIEEHFPWVSEHREAISALLKAYTARKRELGVLDLDDLLLFWRALARDDVIGPRVASGFDHVLVDEYQDVNGLQVDLVRGLAAYGPEITAVGDDFQAIYGFRSASAAHILDFPEHFPGTRVVTLERNYRSTQPVLDAANALAARAVRAFPKRLRGERGGARGAPGPPARGSCACATRARRPPRSATACSRRASRAPSCARRRCSRAR